MPAAQEKHSKPGPLKLVLPPKPCQRPIGTSASNSISSEILASVSVLGQSMRSTPSMVEIAQPRSRLVPKVPSLSFRSLNTGLVRRRVSSLLVIPVPDIGCFFWSAVERRSSPLPRPYAASTIFIVADVVCPQRGSERFAFLRNRKHAL